MIAESLKRRHSGFDDPNQPPQKVLVLCDHYHNIQQIDENSRKPVCRTKEPRESKKRSLHIDEQGENSENVALSESRFLHPKRRRTIPNPQTVDRERQNTDNNMQIKASAQYHQSPAKKAKKSKSQQTRTASSHTDMEKVEDPTFNDVLFWRPVLPDIEAELAKFFEDSMDISESSSCTADFVSDSEEEAELIEYSSFNFWRVPICEVDLSAIQ